MNSKLEIRKSALEVSKFKKEIQELDQILGDQSWSLNAWESTFESSNYFFNLIFIKDELIGFSLFHEALSYDSELHLLKIVLKDHYRGKGLAQKLLSFSKKVRKVFLEVASNNQRAISFYEKYGFKRVSFLKNFYGKDSHAYSMSLLC